MTKKQQIALYKVAWKESEIYQFQVDFLSWYQQTKRDLPWRANKNPYRIWISEIMLQQTQVETVKPYFYHFMESFPTIKALAEAPEAKLLKTWEGLGYYSRARNLQVAAKQIMSDYQGQMPNKIEEIRSLKGIGPYTAGAIASIAFDLPEPAVDGNVMRVVSRLFCLDFDIANSKANMYFSDVVNQIMPNQHSGDFNQAFMDLGSSICTPKSPSCNLCPLINYCLAQKEQKMELYPKKTKKTKVKSEYFIGLVIENQAQQFLLEQRPNTSLLANMWQFPLIEVNKADYQNSQKMWKDYQNLVVQERSQLNLFTDDSRKNTLNPKDTKILKNSGEEVLLENNHENPIFYQLLKKANPPALLKNQKLIWQKQPIGEVTHIFSHRKWHILVAYARLISLPVEDIHQGKLLDESQIIQKKTIEEPAVTFENIKQTNEIKQLQSEANFDKVAEKSLNYSIANKEIDSSQMTFATTAQFSDFVFPKPQTKMVNLVAEVFQWETN